MFLNIVFPRLLKHCCINFYLLHSIRFKNTSEYHFIAFCNTASNLASFNKCLLLYLRRFFLVLDNYYFSDPVSSASLRRPNIYISFQNKNVNAVGWLDM